MNKMLSEAKRLHDAGFALLWIMPREKRPVQSGWTTGERESWEELVASYKPGYNVGVRTGTPSKIGDYYLTCIDVDVKYSQYENDALEVVDSLIGKAQLPEVRSGSGNGSRHLYCLSEKPFKMLTIAKEKGKFEVCVYSDNRQMLLPPSIHPNGKPYVWHRKGKLPLLSNVFAAPANEHKTGTAKTLLPRSSQKNLEVVLEAFEFDKGFDIRWAPEVSPNLLALIEKGLWNGKIVEDRSAYLLMAATLLVRAGLSRNTILTVLTDKDMYLGRAALERRGNRESAAHWVWEHTLAKVMAEHKAKSFQKVGEEGTPVEMLSEQEALKQNEEMEGERSWHQDLKKTEKGKISPSLHNVYLILKNSFKMPLFRFNEFAKHDEVWQDTPWGAKAKTEFQERDVQKIKLWLSQRFGFEANDANIWGAMINLADESAYHPIKTYFEGLPAHDGIKRVDFFLEKYLRGSAPLEYMRAVSRKTIVAMVARVFEQGIKFDTMLVLEGAQGLRKSTAISALAGKKWFSDVNLNLKNKDSISDMAGKWVLEQGEMNVMSKHDVAELKQFLSRDTDRMRPSYGRKSQDYPRQSIFIGTTNEDIYLKDTSGSRRFWPIKVTGDCDIEAIKRDRNQIFAEALALYRAGESIWISDQETNHLVKTQQEERETFDELTDVIEDWINEKIASMSFIGDEENEFDPNCIKMSLLWSMNGPFVTPGLRYLKMDDPGQKRVAACLRNLGYERKQIRIEGKRQKFWVKTRVSPRE